MAAYCSFDCSAAEERYCKEETPKPTDQGATWENRVSLLSFWKLLEEKWKLQCFPHHQRYPQLAFHYHIGIGTQPSKAGLLIWRKLHCFLFCGRKTDKTRWRPRFYSWEVWMKGFICLCSSSPNLYIHLCAKVSTASLSFMVLPIRT